MFAAGTWWITGASSGIGSALAEALAKKKAKLILSGRNVAALGDVAKRCDTATLVLPFEATDFAAIPSTVERAWDWAAREGGPIHGLVNNAGISQRSLAVDSVFDVYQRIIAVDLLGPIALTQALLPKMVAAKNGHIIAISSVAGIVGAPMRSAYSAAKHGLIGYHDSIRAETAHLGLQVLVVAPGSVKTNVSRNALDADANTRGVSDPEIDNAMDPAVAADRILEAITTGKRELILADGIQAEMARLRRADPDALFDRLAAVVAAGYAKQMGVQGKT